MPKNYVNCGDFQSGLRATYGCFSVEPIGIRPDPGARERNGIALHASVPGGWVHVGAHGPFRAVDVACSWVSCRRAAVLAPAWRDTVGIVVGLAGQLDIEHCGRRERVTRSDILLIDTREDAILEATYGSHVAVLHMPRTDLVGATLGGDVFGRVISGKEYTGRMLGALLLALAECEEHIEPRERDVTAEVVVSLVGQALKRPAEAESCTDVATRLQAMSAWLMEHIGEADVSLDRLAREFALSRRSLFRLFARAGCTPQSWIREQRLEYARERLLCANNSGPAAISRICFESGFNDLSTFCHSFRRRFGVSPATARAARERATH